MVKLEKRIDDYWNIDGSRELSDPWTGFTQFALMEEKPPDGYMWSGGEIDEKTAYIQARSSMARAMEINRKARQAEGEAEVVWTKRSILKTHENCEGSISSTLRIRNSKKPLRMLVRNWKHLVAPAVPCKIMKSKKNCGSGASNKIKTRLACILEAEWIQKTAYGRIFTKSCMKTILQEKETIHYSITIWFTNVFQCLQP